MSDFIYYNANKDGSEENDCVTRAIKLGTNLSYTAVQRLLNMASYYYDCDKLCVKCYGRLLTEIFNFPVRYDDYKHTVGEISKQYPYNTIIIRVDGHLTTSIMGVVADIWNCENRLVDCYWIIS
jgi:hypothetical protein